jgi:hypothetical protein
MLADSTARDQAKTNTLIEAPLYRPHENVGPVRFSVIIMGKTFKGGVTDMNWSLKPLQRPEDAMMNRELCSRLAITFGAMGVSRVFAPSPVAFNAAFVRTSSLRTEIKLSSNVSMFRNGAIPADVVTLEPGEAGAFSAGGCPLIVASNGRRLTMAHAGRNCLLDRSLVAGGPATRVNASVVDTMMTTLRQMGSAEGIKVWVYGSIKPKDYPHKLHGEHAAFNSAMQDYIAREWGVGGAESVQDSEGVINFDMPKLIRAQFERHGVPRGCVNLHFAYLPDTGVWSDGKKDYPRNLVAIARYS